jgi:hypothetical protein
VFGDFLHDGLDEVSVGEAGVGGAQEYVVRAVDGWDRYFAPARVFHGALAHAQGSGLVAKQRRQEAIDARPLSRTARPVKQKVW